MVIWNLHSQQRQNFRKLQKPRHLNFQSFQLNAASNGSCCFNRTQKVKQWMDKKSTRSLCETWRQFKRRWKPFSSSKTERNTNLALPSLLCLLRIVLELFYCVSRVVAHTAENLFRHIKSPSAVLPPLRCNKGLGSFNESAIRKNICGGNFSN